MDNQVEARAIRAAAERVYPVFVVLGWKWRNDHDVPYTPTVEQIADRFSTLLDTARSGAGSIASGRLRVAADPLQGWELSLSMGAVPDCGITNDCGNQDHQHYLDYLAALDEPA
jgi:hypothetical protein